MSTAAPPQKAPPPRRRTGARLSDGAFALLLTAPGIALFAAIIFYPLLSALFTGFFRQDLRLPGREFVGLDNFAYWLNGDLFTILEQTLVFTVGATLAPFAVGFALALALNTGIRGSGFLRGVFLFPWVIPGVVVSFLWMWIFNANYGVLNGVLVQAGIIEESVAWLGRPGTAMLAVIVTKTWASFPWMMVMLLAGLQTVPKELHEAASMDGAGAIRRFFAVTWPQVRGVASIVLLLEFIWNFQHFDTIYVLTGGGPAGTTETFATAVYQTAFSGFDIGRATALGGLWMVLLLLLVVVYLRITERKGDA
ncbi:carbohydrate ABC transporter permease [Streptomyces fimicarius]|uniref:Sugar ABC transporter permease n=4 Tax=Streptomyces TaxID=1883 RepID=A0AB33KSR6_9ACTN|nr:MULTISPECIES: sugar ABC transporter permease [Streptomyces]MDX2670899.1 sugar ABC transporter permease [Streptomyces sp. NRRL_ISP-5395]MDX3341587.1 sugar ABC transporter permease [Streptomyces sp. ME02-6979.5a]MDX3504641.1 sugar ABC transporter permease [Streptomyces sp. ATCC51928]MDX5524315.1 sugar ABC transporter permease [Streptomyces sp. DE06-01C]QXQ95538.1 sugar ABC transporter permease [Streptomyces sp. WY228]